MNVAGASGQESPQVVASDPHVSAWVSANAGSGKTYVLVQRVVRLLLEGVEPAKILCLTFTKAAAANMANRVFERLAAWIDLDDAALDRALGELEGRRPAPARRQRARRLFAQALETPGGLKVQTIHAFCAALLHQFPFEADVAARFEVLEERAEHELIERLRLAVLLEAAAAPETPLGRALATAMRTVMDAPFADVIREAVEKRAVLEAWVARCGGIEAALAELSLALGIAPDDTLEQVEAAFLRSPYLPAEEWPALAAAFADGTDSDRKHVERLRRAGAGRAWDNVEAYLAVFCTTEFAPRKDIVTKAIRARHPDLCERLRREQERVCALLARRRALQTRERTAALLTIAHEMLLRYRAEKERRGLLDYDDLIDKTLALLAPEGSAAWVMYKLDRGIDHVLVDEAQDTSAQQWEVIRRLTAEFTAGAGARGHVRRSIFAVGDEKQSIYSFQGAAPHRFDEMRRLYKREHEAGGLVFAPVPLLRSFRSAPDVLAAVDAVFARPEAFRGLASEAAPTVHEAVRHNAPGFVDLWPLLRPEPRVEIEAWDAPFDTVSERSPRVRLARRIAATVRGWIEAGECVGDAARPRRVTPGDILILVRQRGPLFEAIIRALKEAQVNVAGADRLTLTDHIAVMDLVSLGDALLLPEDDLALAEALKSPLFGFDDDDLFALAHGRAGSLGAALAARAEQRPHWRAAAATLAQLAPQARAGRPFDFYARLLGAGGGRRRLLARLGPEAGDALDEFLALALEHERRHTPTLHGFLAWLRAAQTEVKRDMDIVRDEVRVMTVHGAKGLEAPIVILADTTTPGAGPRDPRLLPLAAPAIDDEQARPLVWALGKGEDVPPVADARNAARGAAEDEHRRLLYVAMTRAADRLVVCGAHGMTRLPDGCWFELVHAALAGEAVETPHPEGPVLRWRKSAAMALVPAGESGVTAAAAAPPAWLAAPAGDAPAAPAVVSPSAALGKVRRSPEADDAATAARARGTAVHRLLQSLPAVPAAERAATARRFLARRAAELDADATEAIVAQVTALLAHPAFAPLFAAGTRAEVPIVGRIPRADGRPLLVSGQVDRLALTPDTVFIADFKTDRAPPARWEDVAPVYVTQLALYRAVLMRLYPGRAVRAALVFTQSAALIELPAAALDAALRGVGGAAA